MLATVCLSATHSKISVSVQTLTGKTLFDVSSGMLNLTCRMSVMRNMGATSTVRQCNKKRAKFITKFNTKRPAMRHFSTGSRKVHFCAKIPKTGLECFKISFKRYSILLRNALHSNAIMSVYLSVCPCVCLSVRHNNGQRQNDWTYHKLFHRLLVHSSCQFLTPNIASSFWREILDRGQYSKI